MSRKITMKWCNGCGKPFRARSSLSKHTEGYTRKFDGRTFPPCQGLPLSQVPPDNTVVVEYYGVLQAA